MRRTHLRKHDNILKRLLIHVAGFNLSLILRQVLGRGTARGLQGLAARILAVWDRLWAAIRRALEPVVSMSDRLPQCEHRQPIAA